MQIDSLSKVLELPIEQPGTTKPVDNQDKKPESQNNTIARDSIAIPEKKLVSDDPFADKKPVTTSATDTLKKVDSPKPIDTPRIEVDFEALIRFEVGDEEDPDSQIKKYLASGSDAPKIIVDMNGFDFDDKVIYTPKPDTAPTTPVKPKPAVSTGFTPVPKDLTAIITTNYSDIRGKKLQVRGDVVQPLNKLMEITSKNGIKVGVTYGHRSVEDQTRLWNNAVVKYGSPVRARKWVAPPGKSRHNKGYALDITMYKDGKKISQREFDKIVGQAGFYRPMSWEGWHIEPTTTKATKAR